MAIEDVHAKLREGMQSFEGVQNAELTQGLEHQAAILGAYVAKLEEAKAILQDGHEKLASEVGALLLLSETNFEKGWLTILKALKDTKNADGLAVRQHAVNAADHHQDVRAKTDTLSSVYPDLVGGTEVLIAGGQESAEFIREHILEDQKAQTAEMQAMREAAERFLGSS